LGRRRFLLFGPDEPKVTEETNVLRVYGYAASTNVQKVMWCAAELGLEIAREDVGGPFGGTDALDYLEKNPNGLVPTLIDGDFVLWESNAIVRYLAASYGAEPWYPADERRRATANQWMDWALGTLRPFMGTIMRGLSVLGRAVHDMNAIESARQETARRWAVLDAHLREQPFVAGEAPSIGDIPLGVLAHRWYSLPMERPPAQTSLLAWYERLAERSAYNAHVVLPSNAG
jgi:glutathione S-transferase